MRRYGFTLVELLVVILIIGILAALLIPVLIHVVGVARQGAQEALMTQLAGVIQSYEQSSMKLPPGDGKGSRELMKTLQAPGPKNLPWMEIHEEMLTPEGDLINAVHKDGEPPANIVHYRNNRGRKPGPDGMGRPGISSRREYDLWCAGLDFDPKRPDSAWMILRP